MFDCPSFTKLVNFVPGSCCFCFSGYAFAFQLIDGLLSFEYFCEENILEINDKEKPDTQRK